MKRFIILLWMSLGVAATGALAADADTDIRDLLSNQADAWNRGNLEQFVSGYAEDCTFMGKPVVRSRDKVLARYRKKYPTTAAMGKLTFTDLEVHELGGHVAFATGQFHLVRTAAAGGNASGYFSLVLKDIDDDWRIVLDHTTATPD